MGRHPRSSERGLTLMWSVGQRGLGRGGCGSLCWPVQAHVRVGSSRARIYNVFARNPTVEVRKTPTRAVEPRACRWHAR